MSLNKWMHDKNPYKTPPNFKEMAVKYPEFRKVVTQDLAGKIHLDFSNPAAVRTLTTLLFLKDFGLTVEIPEGSLVPTLPSRMNYLLWVDDLLSLLPERGEGDSIRGLDIGAGACAVYPLLGAKHFGWRMFATETDINNFEAASENVSRNDMNSLVTLLNPSPGQIFAEVLPDESFQFSMCNPPFYKPGQLVIDEDSVGKESEMRTSGGEVEFVRKMLKESVEFGSKVKIFTVLLGHKSSLSPLKQELHKSPLVSSFVSTEFCQGKTMRWGLAWTFSPDIPLKKVLGPKTKKEKQSPFCLIIDKPEWLPQSDYSAISLYHRIKCWLEGLALSVSSRKETKYLCSARLEAKERSWQNQRKRRREAQKRKHEDPAESGASKKSHTLGKFTECNGEDSNQSSSDVMQEALMQEILSSEKGQKSVSNSETEDQDREAGRAGLVLVCDLMVRWTGSSVSLDLSYVDGEAGREGVHQLTQFIKNKVASMSS